MPETLLQITPFTYDANVSIFYAVHCNLQFNIIDIFFVEDGNHFFIH